MAGGRLRRQLWYRLSPSKDIKWQASSGTSAKRFRERSMQKESREIPESFPRGAADGDGDPKGKMPYCDKAPLIPRTPLWVPQSLEVAGALSLQGRQAGRQAGTSGEATPRGSAIKPRFKGRRAKDA